MVEISRFRGSFPRAEDKDERGMPETSRTFTLTSLCECVPFNIHTLESHFDGILHMSDLSDYLSYNEKNSANIRPSPSSDGAYLSGVRRRREA